MRVMFLNCWYGKVEDKFFDFIEGSSEETDVFCFTEVDPVLSSKLEKLLPGFQVVFDTYGMVEVLGYIYGQAIFIKKGLNAKNFEKFYAYRNVVNDAGFVQYFDLEYGGKVIHFMNVHGKARPGTKMDTPARLRQSKKIIEFLKGKKGPTIIGGDFNLNPDIRSVRMFEKSDYKNLIRDFDIKNTRNEVSWKQFNNVQHFADYCFVSPEVKVKSFEVPYNEISDHLPLILDFEV